MSSIKNIFKLTMGLGLMASLGLVALLSLVQTNAVFAATSPSLGTAGSFSVLAETNITNVPTSAIIGDVGLSPATGAGIGLSCSEVTGTIYSVNAAGPLPCRVTNPGLLTTSITDMTNAFTADTPSGINQTCTTTYPGVQDLTLVSPLGAGVYCADSFLLTGNLTLSGTGVWIFKTGAAGTLTTSVGSSITGSDPCNVWWRIGSSVDIFGNSSIIGNILAGTSINLQAGASLTGRALAQAAVTLSSNAITLCSTLPAPGATLTLAKSVNGGSAFANAWTLTATGPTIISGATGSAAVTNAAVSAGSYALSESGGPLGYTAGLYSCVKTPAAGGLPITTVSNTISLAAGDIATCTITNNALPSDTAGLTLVKSVTNDNGGTALPTAWTLSATGPTIISGATGSAAVTNAVVEAPGTYTLGESGGPLGYAAGTYSCVKNSGAPVVSNTISLAIGDTATCTINNNDIGTTPATSVPTLNEWGVIFFMMFAGLGSVYYLRKYRRV